jgi:hypothetical protein
MKWKEDLARMRTATEALASSSLSHSASSLSVLADARSLFESWKKSSDRHVSFSSGTRLTKVAVCRLQSEGKDRFVVGTTTTIRAPAEYVVVSLLGVNENFLAHYTTSMVKLLHREADYSTAVFHSQYVRPAPWSRPPNPT